ncbi:glycosyl hydrolase [Apiospora phragmitis]|uniref:Glycosyl hydrolase n=1 Tax=Apiospora phragmitis TaxID=2905665 RepID=A0ABR1TSZ5_9PEZI
MDPTYSNCQIKHFFVSGLEGLKKVAPTYPSTSLTYNPVRLRGHPRQRSPRMRAEAATTETIWLFHTAQPAGNQDEAVILARTSNDAAQTWSESFAPFPGKKGAFVRQPLVVLSDGTWVLPIFYCRVPPGFRWIGSDDVSAVMYTKDGGKTWSENSVPGSTGCVHMNIVALPKTQSYVAFFRSWADHIYRSTSHDGLDWTPPTKTTLPESQLGTMCGSPSQWVNQPEVDGRTAIWGTPRKALSVGLSEDEGKTWQYRVLEDGHGFCMTNNSMDRSNRELSYPSIFVEKDSAGKSVHVTFTFHRQNIKYVHIEDVEAFVRGG